MDLLFSEKPGKPDAPEIVKVHKNAVALKWKPPKDDGGAEITNYVIEYRIEGISYLFHKMKIKCPFFLKKNKNNSDDN